MGQRLADQGPHVGVVAGVKDEVSLPSGGDQAQLSQLGQMLRYGRRVGSEMDGQIVDRVLGVQQRPQDAEPRFYPDGLQEFDGGRELRR
jgi:hypothetical protein